MKSAIKPPVDCNPHAATSPLGTCTHATPNANRTRKDHLASNGRKAPHFSPPDSYAREVFVHTSLSYGSPSLAGLRSLSCFHSTTQALSGCTKPSGLI